MASPLIEATKFVTVLRSYASEELATQELGFEVYLRKERYLLALSCVQRAMKIMDRRHPTVHSMIIRLCKTVAEKGSCTEGDKDAASAVLDEGIQELLQSKSIADYHHHYISNLPEESILHHLTAAAMSILLNPDCRSEHLKTFMSSVHRKPSLKDCEAVHVRLMQPDWTAQDEAQEWKRRCAEWYPRSTYFEGRLATRRQGS